MVRGGWSVVIGVSVVVTIAEARPPVVAPKPVLPRGITGCPTCRYLTGPRPSGPIVPVQDGPLFRQPDLAPAPLPLPPGAEAQRPLRDLVDRYLPDLPEDERDVWLDELRQLPPEVARDLLAARSKFGEPRPLPDPPASQLPPLQDEPLPQGEPTLLRRASRKNQAERVSETSLAALRSAEMMILHNIANAETIGFKRLLPLTMEAASVGGVESTRSRRIATQGVLEETARPFDLAIDGIGFFQVRHDDTVALTRRGTFQLTPEGLLALDVGGESWMIHPPLEVPAETTSFAVSREGVVTGRLPGGLEICLGQIELARVADISQLECAGGGLFAVPQTAGRVIVGLPGDEGFGTLHQGRLERSNVDLQVELAMLERLRQQIVALDAALPTQLAAPREERPLR